MADGYNNDDGDAKPTQMLPRVQRGVAPDLDGTVEMERNPALDRLTDDDGATAEDEVIPETVRLSAIETATMPSRTAPNPSVQARTRVYEVPDSVMEQMVKDEISDFNTLDLDLELIEEAVRKTGKWPQPGGPQPESAESFLAIIDGKGRIVVPERVLDGRFARGTKVIVTLVPAED